MRFFGSRCKHDWQRGYRDSLWVKRCRDCHEEDLVCAYHRFGPDRAIVAVGQPCSCSPKPKAEFVPEVNDNGMIAQRKTAPPTKEPPLPPPSSRSRFK